MAIKAAECGVKNDKGVAPGLSERLFGELGALPEAKIEAQINSLNELEIKVGESTFRNVKLVRCFPLSAEDRYIQIVDARGEEVGLIEELANCRPEVRQLLGEVLKDVYLVPQIVRINNVKTRGFVPVWDVETDRGHHVFELRTRRETFAIGKRVIIRDADGNSYEIPDYTKLDVRSRRFVEREV